MASPAPPNAVDEPVADAFKHCVLPDRYKTQLCRTFEKNGVCEFADTCAFAHGPQELRTREQNRAAGLASRPAAEVQKAGEAKSKANNARSGNVTTRRRASTGPSASSRSAGCGPNGSRAPTPPCHSDEPLLAMMMPEQPAQPTYSFAPAASAGAPMPVQPLLLGQLPQQGQQLQQQQMNTPHANVLTWNGLTFVPMQMQQHQQQQHQQSPAMYMPQQVQQPIAFAAQPQPQQQQGQTQQTQPQQQQFCFVPVALPGGSPTAPAPMQHQYQQQQQQQWMYPTTN